MDLQEGNNMENKIYHYDANTNKLFVADSIFSNLDYNYAYINNLNANISIMITTNILSLIKSLSQSSTSEFTINWNNILYIFNDLYYLGYVDMCTASCVNNKNHQDIIDPNSTMLCKIIMDLLIDFTLDVDSNLVDKSICSVYFSKNIEKTLSNMVKEKYDHYNSQKDQSIIENSNATVEEEYVVDKKDTYIFWDSYFMGVAKMVAMRSKDPSCKVGACIIRDNKILSTGYNGFPRGLSDKDYPWTKGLEDETKNKYFYVVHAELNAILNSDNIVSGSTLYVTKFPCNECCKAIIQSGIKNVIYDDSIEDVDLVKDKKVVAAMKMLYDAGISVDRYKSKNISITIEL